MTQTAERERAWSGERIDAGPGGDRCRETAGANNVMQALFVLLTERANAAAAPSSKK